MKKNAIRIITLLGVVLTLALALPRCAAADEDDPPTRVARLSYTHGEVSFQPAGTDDWVSAVVNRPITVGDKLWTDKGARAELHIGSAAIRLKGETGFSFLNLTDNMVQIRMTEGALSIRLRELEQDETFEVDTPNLAFSLLRPGEYRLEVNEAGDTTVVRVQNGEGEVTGGGQAFSVRANTRATFTGIDQLTSDFDAAGSYDDFDEWCRDRDRREDRTESSRYVSRDVIGYEDLDDYGYWRPVPEYGTVWFPRTVVVGWAPYRYGHWVWISPWGWTWVDDAPWGFAPFHYGRWVFVGGGWGWVPCPPRPVGVVVVRPVYAPALVAWVGGAHWGVGIGVGGGPGVAWVPLGPREVFVPSYHVSQTYVTNINVTNTTVNNTYVTNVYNSTVVNRNVNVTNVHYVNQSVRGGVTATSNTAFTSAQPVARNLVRVDEREIARAQVSTHIAPQVTPETRSVIGAGARTSVHPPASLQSRAVVAKMAPPPPPASFARQRQVIEQNGGRPLDVSQMRQMQPERTQAAQVRIAPPAKPAAPQNTMGNRPGQPGSPNRPGQPGQPATPNQPGQPAGANQPGKPDRVPTPPTPPNKPYRDDRPPSVLPNRTPPSSNPNNNANRPNNSNPIRPDRSDLPPKSAREQQLEQKQQQQQQKLQQQQDQQRQQLEQRHQDQLRREQQQAENARQQQEHQKLQQRQDQQRQKLEQKQDQQRQKVEQRQEKEQQKQKKEKEKPRQDKPPGR